MNSIVKTFCASTCMLASAMCAGMSLLMYLLPEASRHYFVYVIFLICVSVGGSLLLTAFLWMTGTPDRQSRALESKLSELETELLSLEKDAERREEFIASFAHELKTPLTAIIGYADMLRSKDMAPKPRFTAAGYIFSEGRRLEALSLKLLDIIVAGKTGFERRRYDAGYFIREVAAVTVPSAGGDGISVEIRWDPGEISIEPDLFKTLLINLVDNARKASKKGQKVELYGKKEDTGYAFYVRDYGQGIKPEDIEKIAEPFYMADKSRSRSQNGAGLGLALCRRITELHDTNLEYNSVLGEGTTVRVFLRDPNEQ